MNLTNYEENILKNIRKNQTCFIEKIELMFEKFMDHSLNSLHQPPLYVISIVYKMNKIIPTATHSICCKLLKHLFKEYIYNKIVDILQKNILLYSFCNIIDSCIEMLDDTSREKTSIFCCKFIKHKTIHIHENNSIMNPDFFIYCNYIHKHISQFHIEDAELDKNKLNNKIDTLKYNFPILSMIKNEDRDELKNTFHISISDFLQEISEETLKWMEKIIIISEYIPISIIIGLSLEKYKGFPLIYANAECEYITEYSKSEITGNNFFFLKPKRRNPNENLQYNILSNSISRGVPVSVIITNETKYGRQFYNLLAVNPICDKFGNFLFVIGIHVPVNNDDNELLIKQIQTVIDLMYIFSNLSKENSLCIENPHIANLLC